MYDYIVENQTESVRDDGNMNTSNKRLYSPLQSQTLDREVGIANDESLYGLEVDEYLDESDNEDSCFDADFGAEEMEAMEVEQDMEIEQMEQQHGASLEFHSY